MDVKIAMLDVDGTLKRETGWLPGAKELIAALHSAGVTVALCSGRAIDSLQVTGVECPEVTYLAGAGGSIAQRRDGNGWVTIGERFLAPDVVREVTDRAEALGMEVWAYSNERWYVTQITPRVTYDEGFTHATAHVEPIRDRTDIIKMLMFCENPEQQAFRDELAARTGLAVASSYPGYWDLLPADSLADKGGDLILADLGATWAQTVAVGDGLNDVGMLSRAGFAYALAPRTLDELDPADARYVRAAGGSVADALADLRTRGIV